MTFPITPPFELMNQWYKKACKDPYSGGKFIMAPVLKDISNSAAQWGADQELEAILEIVGFGQQSLPEEDRYLDGLTVASIRIARRPKPPSLKDQALAVMDTAIADGRLSSDASILVRLLVEALPND